MNIVVRKSNKLKGIITLPGDKSISHRAAILLSLCNKSAKIYNYLFSEDCINTLNVLKSLGTDIKVSKGFITITGGKEKFKAPPVSLYAGNSGTLIRLISGLLCGIKGSFLIYGDDSLNKRPMDRIIKPLRLLGGDIISLNNGYAPLFIKGSKLYGMEYFMDVSSAQVKSAIIIASLFAEGKLILHEKGKTRDHTERMIKYLGKDIEVKNGVIIMDCKGELNSRDIIIPGDISSAAFIIGAALLSKDSDIIIKDVLFNETRTGYIKVLKQMGADIEVTEIKDVNNELVATIRVKSSKLKAVSISGDIIPNLIDEIPLIAVLCAFAEGTTYIKDAGELRKKESDRIKTIVYNLRQMGIYTEELEDGMIIEGCSIDSSKKNIVFNSFKDHRIAMAFSLAGLVFDEVKVLDCSCIYTSFPEYFSIMKNIGVDINKTFN